MLKNIKESILILYLADLDRAIFGEGFLACEGDANGDLTIPKTYFRVATVLDAADKGANLRFVSFHVAFQEEPERLLLEYSVDRGENLGRGLIVFALYAAL